MSGGVWPVIKHAPGHGRAQVDSHKELPTVSIQKATLLNEDCKPFAVNNLCPFVMTAHIAYPLLGEKAPATQSASLINMMRNEVGMKGIFISDDLGMEALEGSLLQRAQLTLQAGVDLALYCGVTPDGEMVPNYIDQLNWLADKGQISEETENKIKNLPARGKPDAAAVKEAHERLDFIVKNVK